MTKQIKLHGSNFFATFKTEKKLKEYIEKHNKEESKNRTTVRVGWALEKGMAMKSREITEGELMEFW